MAISKIDLKKNKYFVVYRCKNFLPRPVVTGNENKNL